MKTVLADTNIILWTFNNGPDFRKAIADTTKPTVIIADTIKGKGVSFMENNPDFHGKAANKEQLLEALKELE